MCGHVGCAGPLGPKHEKAIKTLLILDSLRGVDGTGVAVVGRQYDVKIAKQAGNPYDLFDNKKYDKAFLGQNSVVIGHNRWGTQGKVSNANAHPFDFDTVVGAHNGTLKNKYTFDDGHRFDVDSEALYNHINKHGIEEAIHKAEGAWALVFWDKTEKTINFIRNMERPLWMVKTKAGALFWASEAWMLHVSLSREEIEIEEKVEQIPINTLISVKVNPDGTLEKPHSSPLATKVVENFFHGGGTNRGVYSNGTYFPRQHTPGVLHKPQQQPSTSTAVTTTGTDSSNKSPCNITSIVRPNPYTKGQQVVAEVIGEGVDVHGSAYYMCKDRSHPHESIRMYKNGRDTVNYLRKFVSFELHDYRSNDRLGVYHKVQYSTVRLVSEEGKKENFFQDSKGKLIPESEWNKKHGVCSMCTGYVDPTKDFRFSTEGEALCHVCVDDPITKQYVNFS